MKKERIVSQWKLDLFSRQAVQHLYESIDLFAGIVKRQRRADGGLKAEVAHGRQGAVMPRPHRDAVVIEMASLAASGLAIPPGWTSADFVELWAGKMFKRYFHDGTHWRTGAARAAQDKVKIAGGTAAVRIQRDTGAAPLQWLQVNP